MMSGELVTPLAGEFQAVQLPMDRKDGSVNARMPYTVLCAEADPRRRRLLHEAFSQAAVDARFEDAEDADSLLDYLHRRGRFLGELAPRPDLLLVDIDLPRAGAVRALRHIRADQGLRRIPVLIFTQRASPREIQIAYEAGANAVSVRPVTFEALVHVVELIARYWLSTVTLPAR